MFVDNARCPKCGAHLIVGHGGYLTCSLIGCDDPAFVDELLEALGKRRDLIKGLSAADVVARLDAEALIER